MNMFICIALLFDPLYKLDYLKWHFKEIYTLGIKDVHTTANDLGESVITMLLEMFNEYMSTNKCTSGGKKG